MALIQSHTTSVTFLHNYDHGDPLTATRNQSKTWRFNDFIKMVRAMLIGATRNGAVALVGTAAAAGTVTYSSGAGAQTIVINGVTVFNQAWVTSDTATAAAAAAAINASTNPLIQNLVTATSSAGVVTITQTQKGTVGNSTTLAVTGTGATASGTRLTGGTLTSYTF